MDIKEAVNIDNPKQEEKNSSCSNNECKCLYVVAEDSDCISDIDKMCQKVNSFIESTFVSLKEETSIEKHNQIIETCKESIKLLELYKNARLNVELSRKIKFNLDPDLKK